MTKTTKTTVPVASVLMVREDYDKLCVSIGKRSASLSDDIQKAIVTAIGYAKQHGDFDMASKLLNALYTGIMSAAIKRVITYFEAHGPFIIRLLKDDEGDKYFNVKKNKAEAAPAFVKPTIHWDTFNRKVEELEWNADREASFIKGIVTQLDNKQKEHGSFSDVNKAAIATILKLPLAA